MFLAPADADLTIAKIDVILSHCRVSDGKLDYVEFQNMCARALTGSIVNMVCTVTCTGAILSPCPCQTSTSAPDRRWTIAAANAKGKSSETLGPYCMSLCFVLAHAWQRRETAFASVLRLRGMRASQSPRRSAAHTNMWVCVSVCLRVRVSTKSLDFHQTGLA